jgi:hypothetical protein
MPDMRIVTAAGVASAAAHIGGSARGYKSFPHRWQIPTTADQAGGQAVCSFIGNAGRERPLLPRRVIRDHSV